MTWEHRYERNCKALTSEECEVLRTARVVVVGCGGLGGYVAEQLARIGVGHLRLIDSDVFEETNLNRQLFCTETSLGMPKVQVAAKRLAEVNSEVCVDTCKEALTCDNASELIAESQCVIDCLDTVQSRFQLALACQKSEIPLVYGAISGWFGQVCTIMPKDVSFVSIYGDAEGKEADNSQGNLPFSAGVVASFQAAEAIKVLLRKPDILRNRLLMIDLLFGSVENLPLL
jgi:molybdopterin-synthase adenylyltransferase